MAAEQTAVQAWTNDRGVGLSWRTPHVPGTRPATPVTYAVLRFADEAPETTTEITRIDVAAPEARLLTAHDPAAPLGRVLRYAVLPLRGDRVAGVPRVTAPVLVAPDVEGLLTKPVPGGVQVHWRPHPAAVDIEVLRYDVPDVGAERGPHVVPCGHRGLVDDALPPGIYTYRVSCGYPGPGGTVVRSPGVHVMARVDEWPTPVAEVAAELAGDRVVLGWRAPRRGWSTLVPWPGGPVEPGTDVSERFARLTAGDPPGGDALPEPRPRPEDARDLLLEVNPPVAGRLRMTAVSVLGDRAVAGPSVVVESPAPVKDLTVVRLARGRANAWFSWPEPAVLVEVGWHDGTRGDSRRVPRSTHRQRLGAVEDGVDGDVTGQGEEGERDEAQCGLLPGFGVLGGELPRHCGRRGQVAGLDDAQHPDRDDLGLERPVAREQHERKNADDNAAPETGGHHDDRPGDQGQRRHGNDSLQARK